MPHKRTKKHAHMESQDAVTESQQVLAVSTQLHEPQDDTGEIQQFTRRVETDKRNLKALLQQRLQQAKQNHARRQADIAALISDALSTPNRTTQREPATFEHTKIARNAIFETATRIKEACDMTLSEGAALEAMIKEMAADKSNRSTVTEKWMHDVEETERLLKLGHKTAVRNVKKVVGAEAEPVNVEREEEVIGMPEKDLNMELRDRLRYVERGVKRMVKGLPEDG